MKFHDFDDHEVQLYDTEAKLDWCRHGCSLEETFVHLYGHELSVRINPAKGMNVCAPDLEWQGERRKLPGDLKTQNTPFFKAYQYGVPQQFAVTFNQSDLERYLREYPDIRIYFWVNWQVRSMRWGTGEPPHGGHIQVAPMTGVWGADMLLLKHMCEDDKLHEYQRRRDDTAGNAKASYVLDLREMCRLL